MKGLIAGVIVAGLLALIVRANDGGGAKDKPQPLPPRAVTVEVAGSLGRSPAGQMPTFRAADVNPGTILDGSATVANAGGRVGYFSLSQANLLDTPGPTGARLSSALRMEIKDVTRPGRAATVYDGPFAGMAVRPLGFVQPGEQRRYRFVASVGGVGSAQVSGASTSARYVWTAIDGRPSRVAPPRDRTPPRLSVRVAKRQPLLMVDHLSITASCDEACRLSATGGVARRLATDRTARLRIPLGSRRLASLRRSLRRGRPALLRVQVTAADGEGNRATVRRDVHLRPRAR